MADSMESQAQPRETLAQDGHSKVKFRTQSRRASASNLIGASVSENNVAANAWNPSLNVL